MTLLYRLRGLIRWLFRRDEIERDLDSDLIDYIERSAAEKVRAGMSEVEARRAARIELGGVEQTKDSVRATLSLGPIETFVADVGYALRGFLRRPLFSMTAIIALALGIGASVAIFSVVNAVILKPVPYEDRDTLVQFVFTGDGGYGGTSTSRTFYLRLRAQSDVLEDVAAYSNVSLNFDNGDSQERVSASRVTASYFRAFRAPTVLGRTFTTEEDLPGAEGAVVVSHNFWMQRLGGDADVVGRTLSLGGDLHTIVGVVAPDFDTREFGGIDVWLPFQIDPNTTNQSTGLQVMARLRPSITLEQAQARVEASSDSFNAEFPQALDGGAGFTIVPYQDANVARDAKLMLWTLLGAVAFVFLIACTNVANLLLARATARGRDFAIRTALGASQWRIARQLLTESALLSTLGGALGLALGFIGIRLLLTINTAGLPRLGESGALMGLDWRVIAFTIGLSMITTVVFGVLPAISISRTDPNSVIKHSSNRSSSGIRQSGTRSLLVITQIGLAVVLLIGAALLIRTSIELLRVDPGVTVENVIVMRTPLSEPRFRTTAGVMEVVGNTLSRLEEMPAVEAATASQFVPLQSGTAMIFNIIGREQDGPFTGGGVVSINTGGYFDAFEIPLLQGRIFDERDDAGAPPVVVINRALAERWWPDGQDPIGERMLIGGGGAIFPTLADEPVREIVGIVDDVRTDRLTDSPRATMYLPQAQITDLFRSFDPETNLAWIVRTGGDPLQLASVIAETIRETTGGPVIDVETMEQVVSDSISRQQASMFLMAVFGGVALSLAAIGIYGLIALSVQQRTHEIGIRMALGAERNRIARMIIRQGVVLVAIGTAIGLVAAFFLAEVLASVLFGVEARDTVVFIGAPSILALVAITAVSIPALRASRVNPLNALRYE